MCKCQINLLSIIIVVGFDGKRLTVTLQWRHNERDVVSNHQPHDCLLNRLFRRRSKKTSSSASLAFVRGIHRWPVNSPHKWPVTRKMFPFDDVIMNMLNINPTFNKFQNSRIQYFFISIVEEIYGDLGWFYLEIFIGHTFISGNFIYVYSCTVNILPIIQSLMPSS